MLVVGGHDVRSLLVYKHVKCYVMHRPLYWYQL